MARYAQGLNLDEPLAMLRSSATSYYEQDGLGTATSLSNGAGALAQTYTFDSFGKQTNSSGSLTNPFQYTAREFDAETSLYFYRARYYDSSVGRFLLEDPLDFAGGKNFYRYVGNDPVKRKDPLGLYQVTIGGGLGLGAQLTFGNNGGQYNFGLSSGVGEGAYFNLDPTDSGGCHKGGAYGLTNVHLSLGAEHTHATVDATLEDGNPPSGGVEVVFPPGVGISWNPMEPHEPPHGVIAVGVGLFGGVGFSFHSPPTNCGCQKE